MSSLLTSASLRGFSVSLARAASRRARTSRLVTRYLFGTALDIQGVHDDYWDATTLVLRKALSRAVRDGDRVLELGTGHVGVLSVYLAKRKAVEIVAVDVSTRFVENARRVAAASDTNQITFLESDWFSAVEGRRFDVVFCNLPYVPSSDGAAIDATLDHRQIWDGGDDGLHHARTILARASAFLGERGRLLLGVNTLYVPRARVLATIDGSRDFGTAEVVRSRVSPSEVYVCAVRNGASR